MPLWSVRMRAGKGGSHISGAEGLFEEKDVAKILREYAGRAFAHSRGKPDTLVLKAELLHTPPLHIASLPVFTPGAKNNKKNENKNPEETRQRAVGLLISAGVSRRAGNAAMKILRAGGLKGAALLDSKDGARLDPEEKKGVRASMLGITKKAERELSALLGKAGVNAGHSRVKDALVIASKVALAPEVLAELCISDDPDYTTGYVAGASLGYVRLHGIKKNGDRGGGRVFFIKPGALKERRQLARLIEYLGKTPVMVGKISSVDDIITSHGPQKFEKPKNSAGEKARKQKR